MGLALLVSLSVRLLALWLPVWTSGTVDGVFRGPYTLGHEFLCDSSVWGHSSGRRCSWWRISVDAVLSSLVGWGELSFLWIQCTVTLSLHFFFLVFNNPPPAQWLIYWWVMLLILCLMSLWVEAKTTISTRLSYFHLMCLILCSHYNVCFFFPRASDTFQESRAQKLSTCVQATTVGTNFEYILFSCQRLK